MNTKGYVTMLLSAAIGLCAARSGATLREWSSGDYAGEPLAFWDAIDNAGTGSHDASATTWKNLGSGGSTYDLTLKDAVWCGGNSLSNGIRRIAAYSASNEKITYSFSEFAIESCRTNNVNDNNNGNFVFSNGQNAGLTIGGNWAAFQQKKGTTAYKRDNNVAGAGMHTLAYDPNTSTPTPYVDGAAAPYSNSFGDFGFGGASPYTGIFLGARPSVTPTSNPDLGWVSADEKYGRGFHGKYFAIRLYSKALSASEVAWNHAMDVARFHGSKCVAAVPVSAATVPDAYVTSSLSGVGGVEAEGCYLVDESAGHVFRAAPSVTQGGVPYVCTGCTVAAWDADAGDYGAAEMCSGAYAVTVAAGDKVKIAWQYSASASGLLDVGHGYATNGLVVFYDAIDNSGTGVHNPAATNWVNIGSGGSAYDLALCTGYWSDENCLTAPGMVGRFAAVGTTSYAYNSADFFFQHDAPSSATEFVFTGSSSRNHSLILESSKTTLGKGANLGTSALKSSSASAPHWISYDSTTPAIYLDGAAATTTTGSEFGAPSVISLGNNGSETTNIRHFRGRYYAIRLYNRQITADEVAQNCAVDKIRYLGDTAATNAGMVTVWSAVSGLEGREPSGVYFPDAWEFSGGAATQTVRGVSYVCSGYTLETYADGAWGAPVSTEGATWTSPAGRDFAARRITWHWTPVAGARSAADYSAADYISSGLLVNWDAIDNAGTGSHDASATTWKNLGNGGSAYDLIVKSGVWADGNSLSNGINKLAAYGTSTVKYSGAEFAIENYNTGVEDSSARWIFNSANNGYNSQFCVVESGKFGFENAARAGSGFNVSSTGFHTLGWEASEKTHYIDGTATPFGTGANANLSWNAAGGNGYAGVFNLGANTAANYDSTTETFAARGFHGKYHSIRLYDHALTAGEFAWNRKIDVARFAGALTTTNVVVAANEWDGGLAAGGPYEVFGTWTFEASASSVDGTKSDKVRVRALQQDGTWGAATTLDGTTYTYVAGESPATVKIEFRKTMATIVYLR